MNLSAYQRTCLNRVLSGNGEWIRAEGEGDRVTLASLYRKGLLERRAWRGKDGEANAAYEYRPVQMVLEAWRQESSGLEYDPNELVGRAVRNAHPQSRQGTRARWAVVAEIFAIGSTRARDLCRRFDVDPEEVLSGEGETLSEGGDS